MARRIQAPVLLAAVLLLALPGRASAQSGIQVTPDGKRVLVSKNVGAERWALTRNVSDGSVTGNVFSADGGAPQFVACRETGRSGNGISFRCEGADRCRLAPCARDEWLFIAEVDLPASFFQSGIDAAAAPVQSLGRPGVQTVAGSPNQPAGVQTVPDASATLINKDVGGGERWAITFNTEDNTVTGNVFFPSGDDPAFLWCEKKSFDGEQFVLSCFGADRCGATCAPGDWTPLVEVPIAEDFFLPPEQVEREALAVALIDSLGASAGFDALVLALARGHSFRQVAAAALAGRLLATGEIRDRRGEAVEPAEPPYRSVATSAGALARPSQEFVEVRMDRLRDALVGRGVAADTFISSILFMIGRGYSPRQILEAVERDRIRLDRRASVAGADALVIVDENERLVTPSPTGLGDVLQPPKGGFDCGNGIVDPGESCEAGVEITQSCREFGYDGGALTCFVEGCRYDTTGCRKCGNGWREPGEECDGSDLRSTTCTDLGFDAPVLPVCTDECRFDDAPCRQAVEDGCPDGDLDEEEECDGAKFRDGRSCRILGLGRGTLGCLGLLCAYDTGDCAGAAIGCGNGALDDEEQCDGSSLRTRLCEVYDDRYVAGTLGCNASSCTYDTSGCEEAPTEPGGECGDGELDPGESCDGSALRRTECSSVDARFETGTLGCTDDCTYDTSGCGGCGDGSLDAGEDCDGALLRETACAAFDPRFDGGTLGCDPSRCAYDTSDCRGCGDGILDDDENCEEGQLSGFTCQILNFGPGTLRCDENCDFDTSDCGDPGDLCGNGITNPGEDCDGRILPGVTCELVDDRFVGGSLACGDDCKYDTSGCEAGTTCEEKTCPGGVCVPFAADCCGGGFFCREGFVCVGGPGGGCCPNGLPKPCGDVCVAANAACP